MHVKHRTWLLALTLAVGLVACRKQESESPVSSPTLSNRMQIIAERDSMARELIRPGDTLTIYVFMMIDERGVVNQPEVKQAANQRAIEDAITLVQHMHFRPAMQDGKPRRVLMKIPVRFAVPAA